MWNFWIHAGLERSVDIAATCRINSTCRMSIHACRQSGQAITALQSWSGFFLAHSVPRRKKNPWSYWDIRWRINGWQKQCVRHHSLAAGEGIIITWSIFIETTVLFLSTFVKIRTQISDFAVEKCPLSLSLCACKRARPSRRRVEVVTAHFVRRNACHYWS